MSTVDLKLDKRVVERNVRKGLLSKEEYQRYLEQLPDVSGNGEVLTYGSDDASDETQPREEQQ